MSNDMTKIEKVNYQGCTVDSSESHYPYGTNLTLETETLDKLKIDGLLPGDVVEVRAYATIESVSQDSDKTKSNRRITMQLTDIQVNRKRDDDIAKQLYG